ncbi:MAG: elongation factor G [Oscillospiraceae bacterium]|nr:elongation factor G [Oscillospiraceae bacterium]
MSYSTDKIRNVALLGHGNSGKTTLAESMLFVTGAIDRQGKVPDGNTVCDYDAEEIKRQITISTAIAPVEFGGCKINVLDCPGYFDFVGEVACAIRAVEAGIILCTAKDGLSVGAERVWKTLKAANIPTMFCVSKIDEEHGDYDSVLSALQDKYGSIVCAVTAPTSDGKGVIDLVHNVAYITNGNKTTKGAIPSADASKAESLREALMEAAAGADEELMEVFFDTMELSEEQIIKGIKIGMKDRSVVPVVASCAADGVGTEALLQAIVDYVPAPSDVEGIDPNGTTAGFVFKTVSDQFGKYSFVKVMSGSITADMSLRNVRASSTDKLGRLYTMCGKKNTEVKEACCGDIVAVGKMEWKTGDTVCDPKNEVEFPPIEIAEPVYSMAIAPKTKGQDDKVGTGLARLNEEDISFTVVNNPETHQMVLSGAGDIQLDVLVSKLKTRFGVEATLDTPRVPYREKIRKVVDQHARHKKQTGGSGQFADVVIRFEPNEESEELVFGEEVFGGSVPKNFFPAVEKGLREAVNHGVLAGYPVVYLKAILHDGSYHPVDSSEIAFKTAAQLAYKEALPQANPVLLEPIGELKVTIPDSYMGDVMGDLNKRRGRVMGMDPTGDGDQVLSAEVPMAEMLNYAIDLRSITQSRGFFTFDFVRYEEAPAPVQQKAIEEAKALAEEE